MCQLFIIFFSFKRFEMFRNSILVASINHSCDIKQLFNFIAIVEGVFYILII